MLLLAYALLAVPTLASQPLEDCTRGLRPTSQQQPDVPVHCTRPASALARFTVGIYGATSGVALADADAFPECYRVFVASAVARMRFAPRPVACRHRMRISYAVTG
jgi:hypothetical protein